jgi:hypothetical protein
VKGDAQYVSAIVASVKGPVILVGHSQVVMVSHPAVVAGLIESATKATAEK